MDAQQQRQFEAASLATEKCYNIASCFQFSLKALTGDRAKMATARSEARALCKALKAARPVVEGRLGHILNNTVGIAAETVTAGGTEYPTNHAATIGHSRRLLDLVSVCHAPSGFYRDADGHVLSGEVEDVFDPEKALPDDLSEEGCEKLAVVAQTVLDFPASIAARIGRERSAMIAADPPANKHPLDPDEIKILQALADNIADVFTQDQIAGDARLSRGTVRKWLGILSGVGYVARPPERKRGNVITELGRSALHEIENREPM